MRTYPIVEHLPNRIITALMANQFMRQWLPMTRYAIDQGGQRVMNAIVPYARDVAPFVATGTAAAAASGLYNRFASSFKNKTQSHQTIGQYGSRIRKGHWRRHYKKKYRRY